MNISKEAIEKVKELNELSIKLHGGEKETADYLLRSIRSHAEEISELFSSGDQHWKVETGDLIVQCMRILSLYGADLNEMFGKGSSRVENKIKELLRESQ
jgi:hypothetical protein